MVKAFEAFPAAGFLLNKLSIVDWPRVLELFVTGATKNPLLIARMTATNSKKSFMVLLSVWARRKNAVEGLDY